MRHKVLCDQSFFWSCSWFSSGIYIQLSQTLTIHLILTFLAQDINIHSIKNNLANGLREIIRFTLRVTPKLFFFFLREDNCLKVQLQIDPKLLKHFLYIMTYPLTSLTYYHHISLSNSETAVLQNKQSPEPVCPSHSDSWTPTFKFPTELSI